MDTLTRIEQKLDRLLTLLEARPIRQPRTKTTADDQVRAALMPVLRQLKPGRYPGYILASMAHLPDNKATAIAIGRVMEEEGHTRYRTNVTRGFVIVSTSADSDSTGAHKSAQGDSTKRTGAQGD